MFCVQKSLKALALVSASVFSSVLLSSTASAEILFSPTLNYTETKVENPGNSKVRSTAIDLRLGYVGGSGLYLGGLYNTETIDDGGPKDKKTSIGPSVGWVHNSGFNLIATYHVFNTEYEVNGGAQKFTEGKGPQIDIGWLFKMGSMFSLGPQFTWRSIEYGKVESGGVKVDSDTTITEIRPMVAFGFQF